jgi:hypothetical protein
MEEPNAELNKAAEAVNNAGDGEFNNKNGKCSLEWRC